MHKSVVGILLGMIGHALPAAELELVLHNGAVVVPAGEWRAAGRVVTVAATVELNVPPTPTVTVTQEPVKLSVDKPAGYAKGTRLAGPNARDVNAAGSFVKGSLEVRRTPDGELLREGEDYLVDPVWGHVGLGPHAAVQPTDTVFASYRYARMRLDTLQVSERGRASLKTGEPHVSAPVPPAADEGAVALAHIFVPHQGAAEIFPIIETAAQAVTRTTSGRVPKARAKLEKGEPLKIVCLGDSVTAGGNASQPERRYVDVFAAGLRDRFPRAQIEVENISAGGSNSRHWLFPEQSPYRGLQGDANPARFTRVVAAKPDVVTIEFVNDARLTAAQVEETYSDILRRLEPTGAEVILITPHFTMLSMMGFTTQREAERRPYVLALREFSERHHVGLADASARWEHLWKEGLPYLTLLHNTINHPDDRGHRLFAEELWKCFQ